MQKSLAKYFPIFVLPTLIAFSIAFLIPFLVGIYLSFSEFTTVTDAKFIGIGNYLKIFESGDRFGSALWFTILVSIVVIITVNVFAFALAYALTRKLRGRNFFRTAFFLPNLIGGIVLGYTWQTIINAVLVQYQTTIASDSKYGFIGLVILVNWQQVGYMMIIYIAGLQNISPEMIESAQIDGAGKWQTLRNVTLPLVMASITISLFLTLTATLKLYDQNLALTNGAPTHQTEMVALNIVDTFYNRMGMEGVGQAKAVLFFLLVSAIAFIQLRITRRREVEQ